MFFEISILLLLLLVTFQKFYNFRLIYWSMKFKGPLAYPFIGNGFWFINQTSAQAVDTMIYLVSKYGNSFRLWMGTDLFCVMADPDDVCAFLSNPKLIEKSTLYRFLTPWLNEGLLLSTGQKWFQRRKILTPAFHFKALEQFIKIFDRQSDIMLEKLHTSDSLNEIELYPIVTLCALDVICESAMGTSTNAQINSNSDYVKSVKKISSIIHQRMLRFWLQQEFFFRFTKLATEQAEALKILHNFTDSVIQERRKEICNNKLLSENSASTDRDVGIRAKKTFLEILLHSVDGQGRPLSDLDIREEVDTFMFEGHDTTTSGIVFALYNIAKLPDIQEKCYQEILDVLGETAAPLTLSKLNNLHYLELVIKESLRLFPSVPLIARFIKEEIVINGKTYPAGSNCVIPIYHMGHNAQLFDSPEVFRPERHTETGHHPFQYIPFSAGPRNCIGQKFAMLDMKSILSKILKHYKVKLSDVDCKPRLQAELITTAENKINFTLQRRHYKET